jgi:putative ABC transport system substrate-binding protein
MKRREFIAGLGSAAAWPVVVRAQQPATPVIGFLSGGTRDDTRGLLTAFRQGLGETGYVEGKNVAIESRLAEGQYDRLAAIATDLVLRKVTVIAAVGGSAAALAAKAATQTIPIVFANGGDPVKLGLVPSLNRPDGNVTGISFLANTLAAKRIGLMREVVPMSTIGFLFNPTNPNSEPEIKDVEVAARSIGQKIVLMKASSEPEIEAAFASFDLERIGALILAGDVFFYSRREQFAALAARHAVPTIYELRDFAVAGGLMSYGTSLADAHRLCGIYAGRILKGERPSDLPVQQPTKFELVINLKTAKALGIAVPETLLATADEAIQ